MCSSVRKHRSGAHSIKSEVEVPKRGEGRVAMDVAKWVQLELNAGCSCGARDCLLLAQPPWQQQAALVFISLCQQCHRLQQHNSECMQLNTRQERVSRGLFDGNWTASVIDVLTCLYSWHGEREWSTSLLAGYRLTVLEGLVYLV